MKNTIKKIANLSRIAVTLDEEKIMAEDFEKIFALIGQLDKYNIKAKDIEPDILSTPLRNDVIDNKYSNEIMHSAVKEKHNMFIVQKFLD